MKATWKNIRDFFQKHYNKFTRPKLVNGNVAVNFTAIGIHTQTLDRFTPQYNRDTFKPHILFCLQYLLVF